MSETDHDAAIARLEARVAALTDEVTRLTRQASAAPSPAPTTAAAASTTITPAGSEGVTDRRHLLKRAGMVAAGAVAGGAALTAAGASPASAADGNSLVIGNGGASSNTGSSTTELRSSGKDGSMGLFVVQDSNLTLTLFPAAIQGLADNGVVTHGVYGYSAVTDGNGVVGVGNAAGVFASGGRADIALGGLGAPPYSTGTDYNDGDIIEDVNGDLWACVVSGAPGTWRKLAGPNTAGSLHLLATPVRVYDSRPGNPPATGPKAPLANGNTRDIDAKGNSSGVPNNATAVLANFTVVNTSANGFLAAYRAGIAFPGTSTINWYQPGTVVANTTVVALNASETFRCLVPAGSSTDFFVDIIGYHL
jgi:hypothetical protein